MSEQWQPPQSLLWPQVLLGHASELSFTLHRSDEVPLEDQDPATEQVRGERLREAEAELSSSRTEFWLKPIAITEVAASGMHPAPPYPSLSLLFSPNSFTFVRGG